MSIDLRPGGTRLLVYARNDYTLTLTWPTDVSAHTFTATMVTPSGTSTSLTTDVTGTDVTITIPQAVCEAVERLYTTVLRVTLDGETVLQFPVHSSRTNSSAPTSATVTVTAADSSATVSVVGTVGGGGSGPLTPWGEDIDAAGHSLANLAGLTHDAWGDSELQVLDETPYAGVPGVAMIHGSIDIVNADFDWDGPVSAVSAVVPGSFGGPIAASLTVDAYDGTTGSYVWLHAQPDYSFVEVIGNNELGVQIIALNGSPGEVQFNQTDHQSVLRFLGDGDPRNTLAFFNQSGVGGAQQHAAMADADGTLADLTAKFNDLLAWFRELGFIHP